MLLIASSIDVAIVSETWLKAHHSNNLYSLTGYNLFRHDRKKRVGGGVAVYFNQYAPAKEIFDVPLPPNYEDSVYFEFIWIASILDGSDFIIGAVYHPPKPKYLVSQLHGMSSTSV